MQGIAPGLRVHLCRLGSCGRQPRAPGQLCGSVCAVLWKVGTVCRRTVNFTIGSEGAQETGLTTQPMRRCTLCEHTVSRKAVRF